MNKGSHIQIIDDFLIDGITPGKREKRLVRRFKKHWHAHGFTSVSKFISILKKNGFVLCNMTDLTSQMKRPLLSPLLRGLYLQLLTQLPLQSPALDNIIGGGTLLLLQQLRVSGYYKLVFRYEGVYP